MRKSMYTIRLPNKKHNIPRENIDILSELENIPYVTQVGAGHFFPINKKFKPSSRIIGYCGRKKCFITKIYHNRFRQYFYVGTPPECKEEVQKDLSRIIDNLFIYTSKTYLSIDWEMVSEQLTNKFKNYFSD